MGGWNIFVRNCEGKACAISIQDPAVSFQFVHVHRVKEDHGTIPDCT